MITLMLKNINSNNINDLAAPVAAALSDAAAHGPTNFFLSGGSSFELARAVDAALSLEAKRNVSLFQVDERYGEPGHADANENLVASLDLDVYAGTHLALSGNDLDQSAKDYNTVVDEALHSGRPSFAILGVGIDRHVAGIKPAEQTEFTKNFAHKMVAGYVGEDFQRITITPEAIKLFDQVFVFISGAEKRAVVDSLSQPRPINESPAHILRQLEEVTVLEKQ